MNQLKFLVITYSLTQSHNAFFFSSPKRFWILAATRYCSMLLEEGGLQQLELVHAHPQTHADVKLLTKSILESLQNHQARTGQVASTHMSRCARPQ